MNNTYNWKIAALDAYPTQSSYSDVIYTIHWRYEAMDQTASHSVDTYGMQSVSPYNPDSGSFVPYNELTKDIVVGWLTGSMGDEKVASLKSNLDSRIEELINPSSITLPPPWEIIPQTLESTPETP